MRNLKELLQLFLEEENQILFRWGLCNWAARLQRQDKITEEEYFFLLNFILNNKVSRFSSIDALFAQRKYYWRRGKIKPRIAWIKKQIKKL